MSLLLPYYYTPHLIGAGDVEPVVDRQKDLRCDHNRPHIRNGKKYKYGSKTVHLQKWKKRIKYSIKLANTTSLNDWKVFAAVLSNT